MLAEVLAVSTISLVNISIQLFVFSSYFDTYHSLVLKTKAASFELPVQFCFRPNHRLYVNICIKLMSHSVELKTKATG